MPDTRKIQEIGKSLFVSLPRHWVNQMQLEKGDKITLILQQDGLLSLRPEEKEEKPRQIDFLINNESKQSLRRRITGAYVDGFDIIQLRTKNRFSNGQYDNIREIVEELFGLEVVNLGVNVVTVECLLKPVLPIERTIDRIHNIVRTMFDEITTAFEKQDVTIAKGISRGIRDIRRLSLVIYRALRSMILYPILATQEKMSLIDSVDYLHVLHRITSTAYNLKNSSEGILAMELTSFPKSISISLSKAFSHMGRLYEDAVHALISKNVVLADAVLDSESDYERLWDLCYKAHENSEISGLAFAYSHRIIDGLTQIRQYVAEIAEIAIDRAEVK